MSRRRKVGWILMVLAAGSYFWFNGLSALGTSQAPSPFTVSEEGAGCLETVRGIPVMRLRGTPREMGRQHGRLLKSEIHYLAETYVERFLGGPAGVARTAGIARETMLPHMRSRDVDEMRGLAEGAELPFETVLVLNTFLDIKKAVQCSTICVRPPASVEPLFGRNLDFPALGVAEKYSLVICRTPDEGRPTASVMWPGLVGAVSCMNDRGICMAMMECFTEGESLEGMPYALLFRAAMESAASVEDVLATVRQSRRTASNNLMVQGPDGEAKLLEIRHDRTGVRHMDAGAVWATNHHRSEGMAEVNACWRYKRLQLKFGGDPEVITVASMKDLLDRVDLGPINLQAMIFAPRRRELYLAIGRKRAAKGPYVRLTAEDLFDDPAGGF